MTRDEILALKPGRELDALVAIKVFGWHWYYKPEFEVTADFQLCIPPKFWPYGKDDEWGYTVGGGPYQFVRPYSTDIAAAWEVVEKLHDCLHLTQHGEEGRWRAWFCGHIPETAAHGDTAPEAICKAALLAVMEWGEEHGA